MLIQFGVFAMCNSGLCYWILEELAASIFMDKASKEKMLSLYRQAIPQTNDSYIADCHTIHKHPKQVPH